MWLLTLSFPLAIVTEDLFASTDYDQFPDLLTHHAVQPIVVSTPRTAGAAPASPQQQRFFPTPSKETKKNTPYKSKYGPNPVPETGVGWVVAKQPARASPATVHRSTPPSMLAARGTPPSMLSSSIDTKSPTSRNVRSKGWVDDAWTWIYAV